jgi:hypothetical protein
MSGASGHFDLSAMIGRHPRDRAVDRPAVGCLPVDQFAAAEQPRRGSEHVEVEERIGKGLGARELERLAAIGRDLRRDDDCLQPVSRVGENIRTAKQRREGLAA